MYHWAHPWYSQWAGHSLLSVQRSAAKRHCFKWWQELAEYLFSVWNVLCQTVVICTNSFSVRWSEYRTSKCFVLLNCHLMFSLCVSSFFWIFLLVYVFLFTPPVPPTLSLFSLRGKFLCEKITLYLQVPEAFVTEENGDFLKDKLIKQVNKTTNQT